MPSDKRMRPALRMSSTLAIHEKVLGPEHPDVARVLGDLAVLYGYQGRYAEAESVLLRSLEITEAVLGPEHPDMAMRLESYAALLRETGRTERADKAEARAEAIWAKHGKESQ